MLQAAEQLMKVLSQEHNSEQHQKLMETAHNLLYQQSFLPKVISEGDE